MAALDDSNRVVSLKQPNLETLKLLPEPTEEEDFSNSWHSSEEEEDEDFSIPASYWRRDEVIEEDQNKPVIFFVCRGNTCRSSMAVALARAYVEKHDLPFHIDSFGVSAWSGCRAFPVAVKACEQLGMDISAHRSCDINDTFKLNKPINQSIAIICMETWHRERVLKAFGPSGWKAGREFHEEDVFTLLENGNVPDPIGDGAKAYRKMLAFLKPIVEKHVRQLNNKYYNLRTSGGTESVLQDTNSEGN